MQQNEYILNVRFVKQKESDTRVHIVLFRLHEIQSQAKLICAVPNQDSDYHWRDIGSDYKGDQRGFLGCWSC